jgi:hypothetical protein
MFFVVDILGLFLAISLFWTQLIFNAFWRSLDKKAHSHSGL